VNRVLFLFSAIEHALAFAVISAEPISKLSSYGGAEIDRDQNALVAFRDSCVAGFGSGNVVFGELYNE
jgi:NDP-sugar pyrophosphorylase family protein